MSTIVALIGPIEYWWDTPEEPDRFNSQPAVEYRAWREELRDFLVENGFLVYSPHDAFKGAWDERAQAHNDFVISICDLVMCMRPEGIPGKGTDHELKLASDLGKYVIMVPPGISLTFLKSWMESDVWPVF
jgi:hypothetical protein